MSNVIEALRQALGDDCLITGDAVQERASGIWRSDPIQAKAIIRPRTTEQVSDALRICFEHDQPVIAQG
ncbi:MAG: FAD-binding oxidoreductase, partial [Pseudomonadota bacterium]